MNEKPEKRPRRGRWIIWCGVISIALLLLAFLTAISLWGTSWVPASIPAAGAKFELSAKWNVDLPPTGQFEQPMGIAVDPTGSIYVTGAGARIVQLGPDGRSIKQFAEHEGLFSNAFALAIADDNSVLISDYDLDRIRKFDSSGRPLSSFGASGSKPGQFDAPAGLAVDRNGHVYVADFYNGRIQEFSAGGSFLTMIGKPGRLGMGVFHYPTDVALAPGGELVVADAYNHRIQWLSTSGQPVRRVGRHLLWLWPRPADGRRGFNVPSGIAVAPNGFVLVADSANHRIVMLSPDGAYVTDWSLPDADPAIYSPSKIALSSDGATAYATDFAQNRILVLKVTYPD